jgi:CDP-paratose 2-epimerase
MQNNILITGGAGFVGSNLALHLKKKDPDKHIVCFDNLIRQGSELNVPRLLECGIEFIKGDIRNKDHVLGLRNISAIIDCSADPSVLASFNDPVYTLDTNLVGTINCLELARREKSSVIFLSTNRVYPIESLEKIPFYEDVARFDWMKDAKGDGHSFDGINEDFTLKGRRSLYGTSKLCSEHILIEYINMFGIKGVINRFGIIAGPWQMGKADQGIIAYWLLMHKFKSSLKYIGFNGQGKQVRDALHVDDVCDLISFELDNIDSVNGCVFNAGGGRNNSFSLKELDQKVAQLLGSKIDIASELTKREDDIRIYITDNTFINNKTGWYPRRDLDDILRDTNSWIDSNIRILSELFNHETK